MARSTLLTLDDDYAIREVIVESIDDARGLADGDESAYTFATRIIRAASYDPREQTRHAREAE